jgi:hypothetical protein
MAEDGIPEILAEQRLGHEVPGMRGLYAHASDRMRDDLKRALQARWEDSLSARAAIHPHSRVPLLDEILAPFRQRARAESEPAAPPDTVKQPTIPGDREKMISQIPPNHAESPSQESRLGLKERASDLVRDQIHCVELRGFEPLTPSMRTRCATGLRYSPKTASQRSKHWDLFAQAAVAEDHVPRRMAASSSPMTATVAISSSSVTKHPADSRTAAGRGMARTRMPRLVRR